MLNEITLGWLGLHPWEVERYSLNEIAYKISGYIDQRNEVSNDNLAQTRLILTTLYNTAGKSFKKTIKPNQVLKLPGEATKKSSLDTMREAYKIMQKNG